VSHPGYGNQGGQPPDPFTPPSDPWGIPVPDAPAQQPTSGAAGDTQQPASGGGAYPPASPPAGYQAGPQQPVPGQYPTSGPPPQYTVPSSGGSTGFVNPGGQYPGAPNPGAQYPGAPNPAPTSGYPAQGYGGPVYPPSSGVPAQPFQTRPIPTGAEVGPSALGPQARPGRNRTVILLSVALAVLLVVGLTMSGLFISKNTEQNQTQDRLAASQADVSDRDGQIKKLQKTVTDETNKRTTAEQRLKGTESSLGSANSQKQTISQCLRLLLQALDAAGKGDKARTAALTKQLDAPCTKAQKLL
jgi:hypothetical protein